MMNSLKRRLWQCVAGAVAATVLTVVVEVGAPLVLGRGLDPAITWVVALIAVAMSAGAGRQAGRSQPAAVPRGYPPAVGRELAGAVRMLERGLLDRSAFEQLVTRILDAAESGRYG